MPQALESIIRLHGGHFRLPAIIHLFKEVTDHGFPEPALIFEMIGDKREVKARALADRSDAGGIIAFFREFSERGFENSNARFNTALLLAANGRPSSGRGVLLLPRFSTLRRKCSIWLREFIVHLSGSDQSSDGQQYTACN